MENCQFQLKFQLQMQESPLLSILLEAYIDVPPMYFPIPGHPLGNENILLSCPPPVLHNTWGGHDSRKFLVLCPPPPCIE